MKKTIILFLAILCLAADGFSQSPTENLKKYWYYRYRLINNFMVLSDGNEHGTNMPAGIRGGFAQHKLHFGDSPIEIGFYLAVLATEYHLLELESLPTDSTVRELFLVMNAFNRLDFFGESVYEVSGSPGVFGQPSLNGYFIREDHNILPNPFKMIGATPDELTPEIDARLNSNKVDSRFPVYHVTPHMADTLQEVTHDQIWPMLVGLAFISKYIPVSESYNSNQFMDGETSIKTEALNITTRIMDFLLNADENLNEWWTLENPVTGFCIKSSSENCPDTVNYLPPCQSSACGNTAAWAAFGAAEAACKILNNFDGLASPSWPTLMRPYTCSQYHLPQYTTFPSFNLWQGYTVAPFMSEESKVQAIAAVGNSWFQAAPSGLGTAYMNTTAYSLSLRAALYSYEHYPLVRQLLHGGPNYIQSSAYENLLNEAPCQGPWNIDSFDMSPSWNWTATNRLNSPENMGGNPHFVGEYAGIDYMLYHNLYYIAENSNLPAFKNYMDLDIPHDFPVNIGGILYGSHAQPKDYRSFRSIEATGIFAPNANVSISSCEDVGSLTTLDIQVGAEVELSAQCFNCGGPWVRSSNNGADNGAYDMPDLPYTGNGNGPRYDNQEDPIIQADVHKASGKTFGISCYPNPADNFTYIEIQPAPETNGSYQLCDLTGRTIRNGHLTGGLTTIDLKRLNSGYYLIKVFVNEETEVFRVMKY